MRKRSNRGRGGSYVFSQTVLVSCAAGHGVVAIGDNFTNLPRNSVLRLVRVKLSLASSNGTSIFQVFLYDGNATTQCNASRVVIVPNNSERSVTVRYPASTDPLPPDWNRGSRLFEVQHICAPRGSPSQLDGTAELVLKVSSYEIPSSCPTWLVGTPVDVFHSFVKNITAVDGKHPDGVCDAFAGRAGKLSSLSTLTNLEPRNIPLNRIPGTSQGGGFSPPARSVPRKGSPLSEASVTGDCEPWCLWAPRSLHADTLRRRHGHVGRTSSVPSPSVRRSVSLSDLQSLDS